MENMDLFIQRSEQNYQNCVPHISIDCVVFGFYGGTLKVLLLKMKGQKKWGLPGGFLLKEEDADDAAQRILTARTGATKVFLEQFKTFTQPNRSEGALKHMPDGIWFKQRFISIGYYALVNYQDIEPKPDEISDACEWKNIDEVPELMMDHRTIFDAALRNLRIELNYKPIGYNLLPEEFTMPELQSLYETLLGRTLNRGNFLRKMLAYDILIKHDKTRTIGAHRSPILYSFDITKYNTALEGGMSEAW
ncbi:NUDIX hydrolase [Filimonas lacunae]|nr:NUDIX domain-containing protein [Filimonas lacunae]